MDIDYNAELGNPYLGWPNLKAFIGRVRQNLTATIYEWEAEHIRDAIYNAIKQPDAMLKMVTQYRGLIRSVIFPIAVGAVGLFTMAFIGYSLQTGQLSLLNVSKFKLVNFTFTMQLYVLPLSFIGLLYLYFYNKNSFHSFFKFQLDGGKEQSSNWKTFGPIVLIGFAIGTSFFVSFNAHSNNGTINETFWKLLPAVLLFSFTNAWTEEILSRFVIVGGLSGKLPPTSICWISAVIFGLPHFFSGGILSVMVSGLLGWLLAKSVIETQSLGWALLIHFLLDIIVFGAGAMILAGST